MLFALSLVVLAAEPVTTVERSGPSWGAEFGRVSFAIDSTIITGIRVDVLAVPYLDLQAEIGLENGATPPYAVRVGPSGNLISFRNARGEGLSMRGALLTGVATRAVAGRIPTFEPTFSMASQLELTVWAGRHFGVSAGLNGGFTTKFTAQTLWPDVGFTLGLAF